MFADGSEGAALHATVAKRPYDLLISQKLPSAFTDTGLDQWLRERQVETVTIAGYMTQNCDESTARDAVHRGYGVEFLSDAPGTLQLENGAGSVDARTLHDAVLVVLQSRFAAVMTTDQWCRALETGPAAGAVRPDAAGPSGIHASTSAARGRKHAHRGRGRE
ncbi:isochorismatase family protein [uncultured Microbacterium sp.]|uniref:isochorismatase family protein n=1 Tax=uncultured Microbacterium sp. TaxID=191216 RepID=UPI0025F03C75|nr:isochorismatase family protein [uncultured Microbacterium sp.]